MADERDALVLLVELAVPVAHRDEFLACCRADAEGSLANEPGCRRFEVYVPEGGPGTVILVEAYDDRDAHEAHRRTPHFEAFARAVERLGVTRTRVRFLSRAG